MTDRHCGYVVVLDKDVRADDSQAVIDAIMMIRGVIDVRPVVSDPVTHSAEVRVRRELQLKILELLK